MGKFHNAIYEQTCIIITTNKMNADWTKMLDDEVLAAALLDRLIFCCENINPIRKNSVQQRYYLGFTGRTKT